MDTQNASTRAFNSSRSPATAAVDNVIRRALKISDPNNADEVVKGLLARYPDDAARIKREQLGLPFSVFKMQQPAVIQPYRGRPESTAASATLDAALTRLTTTPDLADVEPELRGWSATIQRAASDGFASASSAIDPAERDRAFGARRTLNEYARLARYTGAVSGCVTEVFCRLAQACDDVANIILVMIGDALGDAGITRSGAILQVPAALLQARRDAAITALRNLLQPPQGGDEESWPRGPSAVYQLYAGLEQAGAPDLRALLDEAYLSRELDALVDMANGSTPDGLRALGSAAAITVNRLQRLVMIGQGLVGPDSPPASMFFVELSLFMQGFASGNAGYRLPYLSRSPLLVSAFAARAGIDPPTQSLLALALGRTAFADAVDCLCCSCDDDDMKLLIVAGKVLFDIDRAIDLYALGTDPQDPSPGSLWRGDAEWRAAAYGAMIASAQAQMATFVTPANAPPFIGVSMLPGIVQSLRWSNILDRVDNQLLRSTQFADVINMQIDDERRWSDLVSTIAPLCRTDLLFKGTIPGTTGTSPAPTDPIGAVLQRGTLLINSTAFGNGAPVGQWGGFTVPRTALPVVMPRTIAGSLQEIAGL
ncbi:hypothetical protein [Bradyrhizobium sp.]